jgi:hypothetical protein
MEFQVLGGFEVVDEQRRVVPLSVDVLVEGLWGERPAALRESGRTR